MELKSQFETFFIPSIERMLENENQHLVHLKNQLKRYPNIDMIRFLIKNSEAMVDHYRLRLGQYKKYACRLPD